ncbi:MAG: exodeoxyribonuclease VII small subunit [Gemmatimonadaceae bacterium]
MQPSFEENLLRLEAIITELERGEPALDQALRLFEEGIVRLRAAESLLAAAGESVKQLNENDDGTFGLSDLED